MIFEIGDAARIDVTFTSLSTGALTNPTTLTLTIQAPDNSQTTPSPTYDSTGKYHYNLDLTQSGTWLYRWYATGDVQAVNEGSIEVRASILVPVDPTPAPEPEFTQADLLALDAAIKSGVNRVKFADREMQYNSIDDMLKARSLMIGYLNGQSATPVRRQIRLATSKGY